MILEDFGLQRTSCKRGYILICYNRFMNKISEKIFRYNVIFQPEPEGGFTVIVPSLQGCVSYGKTLDEARKMAIDAIGGFVECMREDGEEIPSDDQSFMSVLDFRLPQFAA